MSYKTYITEALVCGSEDYRTADRSLLLFSREAGMVWASARSVREERSKQRYALQDFSYARVTLVRGKSGWKLTGAESITNFYTAATEREVRAVVMRVLHLLRRVVRGESPQEHLFDDVISALREVSSEDNLSLSEQILTLRILASLGYIAPHPAYDRLLTCDSVREGVSLANPEALREVEKAIEHALHVSQL